MRAVWIIFLNLLPVCFAGDRIPVRYIGGRVCIPCEVAVGEQRMPAHLLVDLGTLHPLILDQEALSSFEIQKEDRLAVILSPSTRLGNLPYRTADLSSLRTFTKEYAGPLMEIPVLGVMGLPAFDQTAVLLDIQKAILEYGDIVRAGEDWQSLPWIQTESGFRLAVNPAEDYTLQAGFTTASYETWIDSVCASIAGFPGGNFDRIMAGDMNLAGYTAFRPVEFDSSNHPDAMIGNSVWQNFEMIADPIDQRIWLRDKKNNLSDLGEQAYFMALAEEDPNAIELYVDRNPSSRLISEAIETLIETRLNDSGADPKAIARACERLLRHRTPKEAAEKLIAFADQLFDQQRFEDGLITYLLEQAKACSLKGTDTLMLGYEAMGRLGRYAMIQKDWTQARIHLLSALFGQPGNPSFNYWMGQYYEAQGQWARAWSRYFRAMLTDNPHPEAGLAIGRLNNNPVFREGFSMQDAQDFLDGYIPIFNPADLPEALENRRLLIEVFTCGDDASCAPLELALQALEETEGVILANYHIGNPAAEPLENRACLAALAGYPGERIPFLVIDGSPVDPNLLPLLNPAEIINGLAALRSPHPPALLQVELTPVSEQEKRWQVTVPVADFKDARRGEILLAEQRCMLFSSTGIVLFRNVVRAGLFNQDLASSGGLMTAELDFNRIQSDNLSYVESIQDSRQIVFNMIPVYIDPKMSFVIAKLYGSDGHLMAVGKQVLDSSQGGGRAR